MKMHRFAALLTLVDFVLLIVALYFFIPQNRPTFAKEDAPILRGRALELVNEQGEVRAKINIESTGETVLRLMDEQGEIRVKLATSDDGSGLVLLNDSTEPGVHILAESTGTTMTLTAPDGEQKVIVP